MIIRSGVSGVIHVASNVSLSSDPHQVIPEVIAGIKSILFSAAQEPSVKRFIFTSSSVAASAPKPGQKLIITKDSWNEDDIAAAWAPPPYVNRPWIVYGASKTQAEQALWQFVKEQKPDFVANAILPNANFGGRLEESQTASTSAWILDIFRGHAEYTKDIPSRK
jgi:nucleoside-diphosphate-sugar epimerase